MFTTITSKAATSAALRRGITSAHKIGPRTLSRYAPNVHDQNENSSYTTTTRRYKASAVPPRSARLTEAQIAHWNSYLATGRGSVALFASIDKDEDNLLSPEELKDFFHALEVANGSVEQLPPNKPRERLDERAVKNPINLKEFQEWLVDATVEAGYHKIQPLYDTHPYIGARQAHHKRLLAKTLQEVEVDHDKDIYAWNASTMSQNLRRMQYAVRGEVVIKADQLAAEGRKITYTNVGNPHAVGQKPLTFYRQVLALCDLPAEVGVDHPKANEMFPKDVLERAREMRDIVGASGSGSYTNSQGLAGVRKHVAEYITERDGGHPAYEGDIFLTNGASSAIELVLNGLIGSDNDAIMIPIPQYPIYSALITRLGGRQLGYELDESLGWAVTEEELERRVVEASEKNWNIKGMALINPGNPTGQVLSREDLEMICRFCAKHGIVLLADEVYQRNIYTDTKTFVSTKKVAVETSGCENLELISFHSTSKGFIGECGRRGGYMELHGIDPYVQSQLYKLASSGLCSGVAGQLMTSLMVKPPKEGGESYESFMKEEGDIYASLKRRAKLMVDGLNAIEGIECNPAEGAMYAFPSLTNLPQRALDEAFQNNQTPDTLYALSLLEETGICVVPASGFGQRKGRIGFRTTFLPPEDELKVAIDEIARHHKLFVQRYSDVDESEDNHPTQEVA